MGRTRSSSAGTDPRSTWRWSDSPASSIAAQGSWGAYLAAAAALLLVLTPVVSAAAAASREGADWRYADGVKAVFNSLSPGVSVRFSYGASPSADEIILAGDSVKIYDGHGFISFGTSHLLPAMPLQPTVSYTARLVGGQVEVSRVV
ncbi:MAG: hypothetical protein JRN56_03205 [Nitrososphaerota archaeon]|nr:hypothetical protein [Nitrososphaerota archaeon]MDG6957052.1 hypothetical protein [Nitrososphaerota archaeon]MDG6961155.1 hypothetical protein [Nitrososphaerota archaeon]MDG6970538.1 hypothetical protein [Nitrososphaerota archaeon]MDG6986640.1 hypothetical protein [Nitrososphaerota archaeon]